MFWVFALIEEYFFMILFLNTTVAMQRQELSFFIQVFGILIGIKCIWTLYSSVIKSFKSYFIFTKGVLFKVLSVGSSGTIKMPYDDETMEKHYAVVCELLKKMSMYILLYFIGFLIPHLLPLDSSIYVNSLLEDILNPAFKRDILILYCFFTIDSIFGEVSKYLLSDACLYLVKDPLFELDAASFTYRRFYNYFIDKGYDPHVALKKTAIFRVSMKTLPLIGLIIGYIIYKYVC